MGAARPPRPLPASTRCPSTARYSFNAADCVVLAKAPEAPEAGSGFQALRETEHGQHIDTGAGHIAQADRRGNIVGGFQIANAAEQAVFDRLHDPIGWVPVRDAGTIDRELRKKLMAADCDLVDRITTARAWAVLERRVS